MTIATTTNPYDLFHNWLKDAEETEPNDPTAMALASVDDTGQPSVRMVLCRNFDTRGFAFFTNFNSKKGAQLQAQKKAALCFHWKSRRRQVRAEGRVEIVSADEADDYYNSRHRNSRIGAWASLQSSPLPGRETLLERFAAYEKEFNGMENPPRPAHWSGFRIVPHLIEFWQEGDFRLHDRVLYTQQPNGTWETTLLYP